MVLINYILIIVVFIILLFIIYKYRNNIESFVNSVADSNFQNIKKVKSKIDNKKYYIQDSFHNYDDAVNMISEINNIVIHFIDLLKQKYPNDGRIIRLYNRYDPNNIIEGNPINNKNSTSYSIAKGKKLVFCLRSKKDKELHERNLLMFVVIHELAHLASISYGHNQEFMENFKFLLREAINKGIYKYDNYYSKPQEYCGIKLTSTPV
jgi:hypothetical protein